MKQIFGTGLILVIVALISGCEKKDAPVWSGPFGLQEGLLFEEFVKHYETTDETSGKRLYETQTVPTPDDRFMHYQLAFDPTNGLCRIVAHGKAVNASPNGHQLIEAYQDMLSSLEERYGPVTDSFDVAASPSLSPDEWMDDLLNKRRRLEAYWDDGASVRGRSGETLKLPDHIRTITLAARAFTNRAGAVEMNIEFKNYELCAASARMDGVSLSKPPSR